MKLPRCLLFFVPAAAAFAAEPALMLVPPAGPVPAAAAVQVDLVRLNPDMIEMPFAAPRALAGRIESAVGSWPVELEGATGAPLGVPPGGFAARRYRFVLPAEATGRLVLTVDTSSGPVRAVIEISPTLTVADRPVATPLGKLAESAPVSSALARTFAGRFMPNQPIYFIYGSGSDQAAKFQFSFDYRLATLRTGEAGRERTSTLRVGYTQRSLWDIDARSSPFYDTSYMPEIAVVSDWPLRPDRSSRFTWMGLRGGLQHESNGRDGDESRSMNRVYLRSRFIVGSLDDWFLVVLPEIHTYVRGIEDNPRIKDYRGYGRLQVYLGRNDGPTLRLTTWAGKDFDHPTWQLDLAYPLSLRWLNMESFLHAQYFNGYGESLRSYERKSDAFRLGFSLVR